MGIINPYPVGYATDNIMIHIILMPNDNVRIRQRKDPS
jgi:hypothetical protein